MSSVLTTNFHMGEFDLYIYIYIYWVGLTVKTVPLLLKTRSFDQASTSLQTTLGRNESGCLQFPDSP